MFLQAASKNNVIQENTVLEIKITTPEGKNLSTNVKLTNDDLALFNDLKEMAR
jgi:hypothetical protein